MNEYFKESKGYRVPKENLDLAFGRDGTILVIENPTRDYFNALYTVSKELRGLATTNDLYFWQADEATHDSMKEALLKNFGIEIKDPYCGIYYKNDTLFLDGYQYLNGNYDADPNENYAKNIMINNKYALRLFSKEEILKAQNHHVYG